MWFFLMAGLILIPIGLLDYLRTNETRSVAAALMGVYCVAIYAYRRVSIRRAVRDLDQFGGNTKIEITIEDDGLVHLTEDARIKIRWNQITRCQRFDGFLMLFSGKLIRMVIPEQFSSEEQIDFVTATVRSTG